MLVNLILTVYLWRAVSLKNGWWVEQNNPNSHSRVFYRNMCRTALQLLYRCSHLPNATQWDVPETPKVTETVFGRSEVESRMNVSHKEHMHYHTLECVASTEGEEAYTLFSISGTILSSRILPQRLMFMCAHIIQTHKPSDLVSAEARCVVTGYRLNEIRTC